MRTFDRGVASGITTLLATVVVGCGVPEANSAHPAPAVAATTLAVDPASAVDAATLAASVTIYRDEFGVPHVYGPTDASVIFGSSRTPSRYTTFGRPGV